MSLPRGLQREALVHLAYRKLAGHYAANVERRHFTQCLRGGLKSAHGEGGAGGGGFQHLDCGLHLHAGKL